MDASFFSSFRYLFIHFFFSFLFFFFLVFSHFSIMSLNYFIGKREDCFGGAEFS